MVFSSTWDGNGAPSPAKQRDFTVDTYRALLSALQESGAVFQTFRDYLRAPSERAVLLRHDVDARKLHSLHFARLQHEAGVRGTYYFRIVRQSFDPGVMREIAGLGHEVGYHYEDVTLAKGNVERAIHLFEQNLEKFRRVVPVNTICMHGSPLSRHDNRCIWEKYDYREFEIEGEPYLDLNFREIFYLTDTGRRWDSEQVSIRDKVENHFGLTFRSTFEIIEAVRRGDFPPRVMINFHPQRWTDNFFLWLQEKYAQEAKNRVKYLLNKWR